MMDDAPRPKAILFDLDEVLVDARPAWCYAVEETLMSMTARRESAKALCDEYRKRPLWDVFRLLLPDRNDCVRAEKLASTMLERSALKKLLVHEGVGMALDEIRVRRIDMGVISRYPHSLAIKHLQSTGIDRFFAVLSPTPAGAQWSPRDRIAECLAYLGHPASRCAYVSGESEDLRVASDAGLAVFRAEWTGCRSGTGPGISRAGELSAVVLSEWAKAS